MTICCLFSESANFPPPSLSSRQTICTETYNDPGSVENNRGCGGPVSSAGLPSEMHKVWKQINFFDILMTYFSLRKIVVNCF